jgi:hypothetical protein
MVYDSCFPYLIEVSQALLGSLEMEDGWLLAMLRDLLN